MSPPNRRPVAFVLATLIGLVAALPASAGLDRFIERQMERAHVPGLAAGIVKHGTLVWSRGYGWADVEGAVPATDDTLFMLASVSKTVTGTAVLTLHDAGKLDLDADVNRYLPFAVRNPNHRQKAITTRQLLTHSASLRDDDNLLFDLYTVGDAAMPLGQFLRRYLGIERVRFGERLSVDLTLDEAVGKTRVPAFLLQPLVENSIRHGLAPKLGPVSVTVHASAEPKGIRVTVTDDGVGWTAAELTAARAGIAGDEGSAGKNGSQFGLRNVAKRLRGNYGLDASMDIAPEAVGGSRIVLFLPTNDAQDPAH